MRNWNSKIFDIPKIIWHGSYLDRAEVTRSGGLHQRSPPALALVLQPGVVLEQEVRHVGVTILTGVRQRSVTSSW